MSCGYEYRRSPGCGSCTACRERRSDIKKQDLIHNRNHRLWRESNTEELKTVNSALEQARVNAQFWSNQERRLFEKSLELTYDQDGSKRKARK